MVPKALIAGDVFGLRMFMPNIGVDFCIISWIALYVTRLVVRKVLVPGGESHQRCGSTSLFMIVIHDMFHP